MMNVGRAEFLQPVCSRTPFTLKRRDSRQFFFLVGSLFLSTSCGAKPLDSDQPRRAKGLSTAWKSLPPGCVVEFPLVQIGNAREGVLASSHHNLHHQKHSQTRQREENPPCVEHEVPRHHARTDEAPAEHAERWRGGNQRRFSDVPRFANETIATSRTYSWPQFRNDYRAFLQNWGFSDGSNANSGDVSVVHPNQNNHFLSDSDAEDFDEFSDWDNDGFPPETNVAPQEVEGAGPDGVPLAYRYYRRAVTRHNSAWTIPFILLGPDVDHWQTIGQELAAAGFTAIACERIPTSSPASSSTGNEDEMALGGSENVDMIALLLDALRWNRAVLVACDSEALPAIQAALHLAPHRVAGLVLCGQLEAAETLVAHRYSRRAPHPYGIDRFLNDVIKCPFTIVWDGSDPVELLQAGSGNAYISQNNPSHQAFANERSLVIGGGYAPHRRQPELFAWVLTRFVEEKITPPGYRDDRPETVLHPFPGNETSTTQNGNMFLAPLSGLIDFFRAESLVVIGRALAYGMLYGTILRVGVIHYHQFRSGLFDFQTKLQLIIPSRVFAWLVGFFNPPISTSLKTAADSTSLNNTQIQLPLEVLDHESNVLDLDQDVKEDEERDIHDLGGSEWQIENLDCIIGSEGANPEQEAEEEAQSPTLDCDQLIPESVNNAGNSTSPIANSHQVSADDESTVDVKDDVLESDPEKDTLSDGKDPEESTSSGEPKTSFDDDFENYKPLKQFYFLDHVIT